MPLVAHSCLQRGSVPGQPFRRYVAPSFMIPSLALRSMSVESLIPLEGAPKRSGCLAPASPDTTAGWHAGRSGSRNLSGSAISPVLTNLYLHYAFDMWLSRTFPAVTFERYCDDAVIHCTRPADPLRRTNRALVRIDSTKRPRVSSDDGDVVLTCPSWPYRTASRDQRVHRRSSRDVEAKPVLLCALHRQQDVDFDLDSTGE